MRNNFRWELGLVAPLLPAAPLFPAFGIAPHPVANIPTEAAGNEERRFHSETVGAINEIAKTSSAYTPIEMQSRGSHADLPWPIRRGRVAFPERVKSGRPLYGEVGNVKDSTGRLKQLLAAFRSSLDLSAFAKGPAFRISRAPAYSLRDENER